MLITLIVEFGVNGTVRTVDYGFVAPIMVPGWLAVMALGGAHDYRHIATNLRAIPQRAQRWVRIRAGAACESFALHASISRDFILSSIPLDAILTVARQKGARRVLHHRLSIGVGAPRVVAIGLPSEIRDLVQHVQHVQPASGA